MLEALIPERTADGPCAARPSGSVSAIRACTLLAAAALCVPADADAQTSLDPSVRIQHYVQDTWRMQDGLPHTAVREILQTRDGYLWLGTLAGLVRFDGVEFKTFDDPSLMSDQLRAVVEAPDGSLLAGFVGGGARRLRNGKWEELVGGSTALTTVHKVLVTRDGTIWLGTESGVATVVDGRVAQPTHALFATEVSDMAEDRDGRIWVATRDGLLRADADTVVGFTTSDGMPASEVSTVLPNPDGTVWAGTWRDGIAILRGDRVIDVLTTADGLTSDQIRALYRDRAGTIWIGTETNGIVRYADGAFSTYDEDDGLLDDRILSFFEDVEGNLWVGTYGGLLRLKNPVVTTFGAADGLAGDRVQSIFEAADGTLWVASLAGIARIRGDVVDIPSWLPKDGWENARTVYEDGDGALWVGTDAGLRRYQDGRWSTFTTADGLPDPRIVALYEDAAGDLWVGTRRGLSRWTGDGFAEPPGLDGFVETVMTIHEDREGTLWVGSERGLFTLREGAFERVEIGSNPEIEVRHIHEDAAGTLWMGTLSEGLIRYREGKHTRYLSKDGMPDDGVWMTFEIDDGRDRVLWMCSDVGISSVSKQELEAYAQGTVTSVSPRTYGTADGMRTPECMGIRQPGGASTADGAIWFPTRDGAVRVVPGGRPTNPYVPPVVVQEVLVNDSAVAFADGLVLPPGGQDVEFRFAGLSYVDADKVRFRYRLEDYDDDWIEAGTRRWAHYANLPPDEYRFRVLASNNDGLWNEEGATVSVAQLPFFYQTSWFRGVSMILAILGLYGGYRWRVRALRARLASQEAAEQSERQAKEYFLSIYENAAFGIYLGTTDGRFQDANPVLAQMLGYPSPEELMEADPHAVYAEADRHGQLIEANSVEGVFKDVQVEWTARDGKPITARLNGRALERDGHLAFVTIAEDITGEKALEQQLRQTQKMEAVGRLAGGVAHDFNNLLTVITGHAEMWLKGGSEREGRSAAEKILTAGRRAASLTRQLLTFSRRHVAKPRVIQLNEVIENLEPMLERLMGERIEVVTQLGTGLPSVKADPAKLEQVLVNLVLNARDAMPAGGRIRLRTAEKSIGPWNEWGLQPGDYVVAAVSDSGAGMVKETIEHVFEPFFTTKEVGQGSGLGLSTAYGIVQEAGGVITVASLPERGTTFEVVLPRSRDVPTPQATRERPQPSETRVGVTILLVEDDDAVRALVTESLEAAGFEVLVADGPEAALELASPPEQRIDLMLTDVVMPGMTGVELGELLSDARPSMKKLFMSGYPDYELGQAAESFLEKPFAPEQLVSRVAALLDDDSKE